MNEWKIYKLIDFVEINPTESLKKGTLAKKIGMDLLQPYTRAIPSYTTEFYSGGTKFRNGDTIMARITPCLENGKTAMVSVLEENEIELIILAGFMCILSADFTKRYENRIINVHPSLIPSFCGEGFYGLHVHEAALNYGVKVTGATVHFVNEIPDGGKIIAQKAVEILDGDTPEILQKRVMENAEWIILPEAAEKICKQIKESK